MIGGWGIAGNEEADDMIGYLQLTRRAWYHAGGFAESRCVRVTRGKRWAYFWRV